jgi:signal transduction histidine kinase
MLLAAAVMAAANAFLLGDALTGAQLEDMRAKSELFLHMVEESQSGGMNQAAFGRLCASFIKATDAAIGIVEKDGTLVYFSSASDSVASFLDSDDAARVLQSQISLLLAGGSVMDDSVKLPQGGMLLVTGIPMKQGGGVLLLQPSAGTVSLARHRFSTLFLWVALTVLPLTLLSMALRIKKATLPLYAMSEAAITMSRGNFNIRLDESAAGEVGVLARALNNLCETLSGTIYQLRFEKSQLDEILQSLTDGVAAMDGSGALTHCNSALMRMFGAVNADKREDISEDGKLWLTFDEVFDTGKPQTITYPMAGDKMLWITISPVVNEDGSRTGVVGLFKDMTEMERLEATRREYVANVSHELRTPLTAVRGLLEPLSDGMVQDEETRQRYYKTMLHEVMRLSRLITDMMTLSRLQAGTEYIDVMRVDMRELLSDVASSYTAAAENKGIELMLDARQAVDGLTDPDRIEQVLVILLDNAMRYTPAGGSIRIRVETSDCMLVSVEDTGCGISQEDLPHIFERFYKADKSRGSSGTGLGLSIAHYVLEKLGECIYVRSEAGKGACFTFTVKRYVSNAIALGPANENRRCRAGDMAQEPPARVQPGAVVDADYEVMGEEAKKRAKPGGITGRIPTIKMPDRNKKRKE